MQGGGPRVAVVRRTDDGSRSTPRRPGSLRRVAPWISVRGQFGGGAARRGVVGPRVRAGAVRRGDTGQVSLGRPEVHRRVCVGAGVAGVRVAVHRQDPPGHPAGDRRPGRRTGAGSRGAVQPATHDLVRFYPRDAANVELPIVGTGPVFWIHFVYANVMILVATTIFMVTMVRLSQTYRLMAMVMVAAALLPWGANLLHNFEVGWFARLDLTLCVHHHRSRPGLGSLPRAPGQALAAGARSHRGQHDRRRVRS